MTPLFTPEQMQHIADAEKWCAMCDSYYASLRSLGLDVSEREMLNESRKASIQRIREIDAQSRQEQRR